MPILPVAGDVSTAIDHSVYGSGNAEPTSEFGKTIHAIASSGPHMGASPSSAQKSATEEALNQDYVGFWEGLVKSIGEMQAEQMKYNEERDKTYMDWQEHMSNTAYQRAMADMKAAGLNPILAYQQGGATTPSVTSSNYSLGGGDTLADFVNMLTGGINKLAQAIADFIPSAKTVKVVGNAFKK